jgi:pimeloyl-ACP methyl ester carboxylesterase
MHIVDVGSGEPVVLIPGLHGRWEYTHRAVAALAASCRVIAFSLADEPGTECPFDPARPIPSYVEQVARALDQARIPAAALCGISFGGIVALQFAAEHPERVSALVLASTPGPHWTLDPEQAMHVKHPRLTAPIFFARMPQRLRPEIVRALPNTRDRARLGWDAMRTLVSAPVSPSRMAARARAIEKQHAVNLAALKIPTLVIVGESALDRVVPVAGTTEYARLIAGARLECLEGTGHQGSITKPDAFAGLVSNFVRSVTHAAA